MGPLEFLVVGFDGNRFSGEIMPEIRSLRQQGTIRVLDLLFLRKDASGAIETIELADLPDDELEKVGEVDTDEDGWFSVEDIDRMKDSLPANSSVAMLLVEHSWATRLAETIRRANGQLLYNERIPIGVAEQVETVKTSWRSGGPEARAT
jgi:Family of unknown function (DUF6325)